MPKPLSAGILAYRTTNCGSLEVLLAHPGGPFFENKDEGVWSVPKGLVEEDEEPREAAIREFGEETGVELPEPEWGDAGSASGSQAGGESGRRAERWRVDRGSARRYIDLGEITQRSGKRVAVWAVDADLDPDTFESNFFEMEWPPRTGRREHFPEIDRCAYFDLETARRKMNPRQVVFLDRLVEALG
jgi:predicted NUDIX family NTP pyrophosphohydrolase